MANVSYFIRNIYQFRETEIKAKQCILILRVYAHVILQRVFHLGWDYWSSLRKVSVTNISLVNPVDHIPTQHVSVQRSCDNTCQYQHDIQYETNVK